MTSMCLDGSVNFPNIPEQLRLLVAILFLQGDAGRFSLSITLKLVNS